MLIDVISFPLYVSILVKRLCVCMSAGLRDYVRVCVCDFVCVLLFVTVSVCVSTFGKVFTLRLHMYELDGQRTNKK